MDYLYVCLLSNGVIKVGRSLNPRERIEQHDGRVACLGISVTKSHYVSCLHGSATGPEAALIARCADAALARHENEWFEGLNYEEVCLWADDASMLTPCFVEVTEFGERLRAARVAAGLTQLQLGAGLGKNGADLTKGAVSAWERRGCLPNAMQINAICARLGVTADSLVLTSKPIPYVIERPAA